MKNDELAELLKYINPRSILVVNHKNRLIELYCPFKVKALQSVGNIKKGQFLLVDEVKITPEIILVYIIEEKAYYYYHFNIMI